jgi:hypothetical protein
MFITIDSAQALDAAHDDQECAAGGERAAKRGRGEQRQPGHEHAPAPEQVGRPPAEQQEPAEGERVRGHHPLQVRLGEMQLDADRRQRDVDDKHVDRGHEVGHGKQRKRPPPADSAGWPGRQVADVVPWVY